MLLPSLLRECLPPTLLSACVFGVILSSNSTLDSHEVLVAQTAREMLASGDFIHPTFSGEPRLQKPPLAYWTCCLSFIVFGESETSSRLPSAFAAVVGVFFTSLFARRAFGPGMGLLAGGIQATSVWNVTFGRMAVVDSMLTTLVTAAALVAAWDRLSPKPYRRWWIAPLFWILAGLIVLAKGPVGIAMLLPPVALYRMMRGRTEGDSPLLLSPFAVVGVVGFLFLSLAWPAAVLQRHPDAWQLWTGQSLGRFQERWGPQTRPWWYFFAQTPWLLFPWSVPLVVWLFRRPTWNWRDPNRLLVAVWFGTAFLLCTLSAGKRSHYILPGLPAACIGAAIVMRELQRRAARREPARPNQVWKSLTPRAHASPLAMFALLGAIEAAFTAGVVVPSQSLAGFREMVERNRDRIEASDVIQVGSRHRATIFPVDRPLQWLPEAPVDNQRALLIVAPEKKVPEILSTGRATIIDRIGNDRSPPLRPSLEDFALLELAPIK